MIRKFAFVLIAVIPLLGLSLPARAQMTDDAVIEYVKDGMSITIQEDGTVCVE